MKIGISTKYQNLSTILNKFEGYNIEHVQFALPSNFQSNYEEIIKIASNFRNEHPNIELSIHAYPYNLAEPVEAIRALWIEMAEEAISFAAQVGAKFINFHGGYASISGRRDQHTEVLDQLIPVICRLTYKGIEKNVEIHIENLYPEARTSDFSKMCDRNSDFEKIFASIDSPFLKLCYDYGHGNLDEKGIDILRKNYERLGSLHVHDNDQISDIHWPIGDAAPGTINWLQELKFLEDIKFDGAFILESYLTDQIVSLEYLKKLGKI